jgi:glycosyltransferase involved in cell wall biosynthesis
VKPLRVRTGRGYEVDFNVALGQTNAEFTKRTDTPLGALGETLNAVCVLEPGYDLVHCVNAIPLFPRLPFFVTFEDYLPRLWPTRQPALKLEQILLDQLLSDRCAGVFAMSEYAVRQFTRTNADHPNLDALLDKLQVLYPSVVPRATSPKQPNDTLRLLSVGADFMRKGVPALVRAHEQLREQGIPVETTVVSSLHWSADDYIGPADAAFVESEISRLDQPGITHLGRIENDQALNVMESHDFLVLPTFHDTFGYVNIEAMAGGTPVIASATCAIPEIIDDGVSGYLLTMENDAEVGKWPWIDLPHDEHYTARYMSQTESFANEIALRLQGYWADRSVYEEMSAAAVETVASRFNRHTARALLEQRYAEAVS